MSPQSPDVHGPSCASTVRVAFRTLGCKVNRVESDQIAAELLGSGAVIAPESEADVIVINTCTVTGEADSKARKAVRHALNEPGRPVVVVTGCLAALDAAALNVLGERVVVEADKERVVARVSALLGLDTAGEATSTAAIRTGSVFRTRTPLKIQDGCDAFCSYCIVPHARGVPRSVPLASVVAVATELVASGTPEFVLTGINLGRYRDPDTDADLADVVAAVAQTGVARMRLSSLEPLDLTERLLGVLAATQAVCAHLHIPLQSGADEVLRAMVRGYTVAQFEDRIAASRDALPGVAITTDVIAGFPGETADHAAETAAACERIGFSKLHVFRYSERAGTPAAQMPGVVPKTVRAQRAAELRDLSATLAQRYSEGRVGERVEVLVERVEDGIASGTTREYLHVDFEAGADVAAGDLVVMEYRG